MRAIFKAFKIGITGTIITIVAAIVGFTQGFSFMSILTTGVVLTAVTSVGYVVYRMYRAVTGATADAFRWAAGTDGAPRTSRSSYSTKHETIHYQDYDYSISKDDEPVAIWVNAADNRVLDATFSSGHGSAAKERANKALAYARTQHRFAY
jgi:hypothetical protein